MEHPTIYSKRLLVKFYPRTVGSNDTAKSSIPKTGDKLRLGKLISSKKGIPLP